MTDDEMNRRIALGSNARCFEKLLIEKELNNASSHEDAERIAREQDDQLTPLERLAAFMKLMEPYYAVAPPFERICRVDDLRNRQVHDDWGLHVPPLPETKRNR